MTIDYYYSVRSVYAYFGSPRVAELARRFGRTLRHCPIDLSQVVPAFGSVPFSERGPKVRDYYFGRELERWSAWLAMPVVIEPVHHYGDRNLPSGCVLAAQQLGQDAGRLSDAILSALWRDDRDIADVEVLGSLLIECAMDPGPVLELALSADIQRQFKECTARAIDAGVPGSPTYSVDGQLFYGQDRLMFVEHQLKHGFRHDQRAAASAGSQNRHTASEVTGLSVSPTFNDRPPVAGPRPDTTVANRSGDWLP